MSEIKKESKAIDMTQGSISSNIIKFAIPLVWGTLLQQLYNVVDSLVVGNFVGKEALAAVTSAGSLIFLLIGFFNGLFMGAGVVISQYFGAKNEDRVQKTIHTAIGFALIAGLVLTVVGSIFTPHLLKLINVPDDVIPDSLVYFRIYFYSVIAVVLYNTASGIFQAIGDSRHPLIFLLISSVLNIVLDLLFVAVFNMGVGGAAWATTISQFVSAILSMIVLLRTKDIYKVSIKDIKIEKTALKEILKMGVPAGIQNSVTSLSHVFIQSSVNVFGSAAIAGNGAYGKIEQFAIIPLSCIGNAMATFIGQNVGAEEYDRAKKGVKFGITLQICLSEAIGILVFIFAPWLIKMFNSDPEVITMGVYCARIRGLFYFLLAFSNCVAGIMRGAGKAIVSMNVSLICWCVIRVGIIYVLTLFVNEIWVVHAAFPITWLLSTIVYSIYLAKGDWLYGYKNKKQ